MQKLIATVIDNESLLLTLGIFSLVFFVGTLIVIPWLILRIPEDYFQEEYRHSFLKESEPPLMRYILLFFKNLAGVLFLLLGILLLVLPGQGLLTMLVGIILLDFPGKYQLERWFVQHKTVLRSINWLRKKGKRAPIIV